MKITIDVTFDKKTSDRIIQEIRAIANYIVNRVKMYNSEE